jgi:replicative DNA helicase
MPDGSPHLTRQTATQGRDTTAAQIAIEAERALLGALLCEPSMAPLAGALRPEHFFEPLHGEMYRIMAAEAGAGRQVDLVGVWDRIKHHPAAQTLGVRYLGDLVDHSPPSANLPDYAAAVTEAWAKRAFLELSAQAHGSPGGQRSAGRRLHDLGPRRRTDGRGGHAGAGPDREDPGQEDRPQVLRQAAWRAQARRSGRGRRPPVHGQDLARPGRRPRRRGENPHDTFLFLGIEMGPEEMMQRELSALTFEHGEFETASSTGPWARQVTPDGPRQHRPRQSRVPANLILDDCASLGVDDVRRKVWALKRRGQRAPSFIDYLQLMRRPAANGRNDAAVIGEITQGLKQIARQAGICIVLLSQLSRAVENRDDKRPQLADLRESGSSSRTPTPCSSPSASSTTSSGPSRRPARLRAPRLGDALRGPAHGAWT